MMKFNSLSRWLLAGLSTSAAAGVVDPFQHPIGDVGQAIAHISRPASGMEAAPTYRKALLSLHKAIVETESVTGTEEAVGDVLVDYLTKHGFVAVKQFVEKHERTPPGATRFNVIAWPKGSAKEKGRPTSNADAARLQIPSAKVLLSSHIDVVPPHIPYSIDAKPDEITSDTVIHGRGSDDAKASVAAQIIALQEILEVDSDADIMVLYVVGEEEGGDGMKAFSEFTKNHPDSGPAFGSVIFGEPTENKLACGHKGMISCRIYATGQAGHSGYPWLGKSANELLLRGLLKVLDTDLGATPLFGNTTVNIGRMSGGIAGNVIPPAAEAQLAIRVAIGPELTGHTIVRERLIEALSDVDPEALHAECGGGYGSVGCNCDVHGFDTITVNYGTDVPNMAGNHTRYLYGPGTILVAHSDHETVTVGQLEEAVEGYKKLILHSLSD